MFRLSFICVLKFTTFPQAVQWTAIDSIVEEAKEEGIIRRRGTLMDKKGSYTPSLFGH